MAPWTPRRSKMAVCLKCGHKMTTKVIGDWLPGKGLVCSKCANREPNAIMESEVETGGRLM